ncbi:MAG: bifunctional phosphoribosylaminoimidazolecarboxamide formyltransferase/IMP cyclohydrolase PurH [Planctomycetota bacterium]|nr:MAG: bifunctional phosphoribosylaminoimidazolecarboxamide formyltransferase/IMP cyclohydrolase PurH [Planctomycetota bacterium]
MQEWALISVTEKEGIEKICTGLIDSGLSILATQGTAEYLSHHGIEAHPISSVSEFPEILGGRVKTLHPKIFGGLLANPSLPSHQKDLAAHQIPIIRVLMVNLYPFSQKSSSLPPDEALEWVDIGGAALIRSALKNVQNLLLLVDSSDWHYATKWRELDLKTRRALALKGWHHLIEYDQKIYEYYLKEWQNQEAKHISLFKVQDLRYGENPHQKAILWSQKKEEEDFFSEITGKTLSYNNYLDLYSGYTLLSHWDKPGAVVVKHTIPCGAAMAKTLETPLEKLVEYAWQGDSRAAFGGVVLIQGKIEVSLFTKGPLKGKFIDLLGASSFTEETLEYLQKKRPRLKLVTLPSRLNSTTAYRSLGNHFLSQEPNNMWGEEWKTVTQRTFPERLMPLANFGVKVNSLLPSNAISIVTDEEDLYWHSGHGAGQPSRIGALENLALPLFMRNMKERAEKLGWDMEDYREGILERSVLISDGFFPFPDSVDRASQFGIQYIVQPGGSKKDGQVMEKANEIGVSMIFTGIRHFRH